MADTSLMVLGLTSPQPASSWGLSGLFQDPYLHFGWYRHVCCKHHWASDPLDGLYMPSFFGRKLTLMTFDNLCRSSAHPVTTPSSLTLLSPVTTSPSSIFCLRWRHCRPCWVISPGFATLMLSPGHREGTSGFALFLRVIASCTMGEK